MKKEIKLEKKYMKLIKYTKIKKALLWRLFS